MYALQNKLLLQYYYYPKNCYYFQFPYFILKQTHLPKLIILCFLIGYYNNPTKYDIFSHKFHYIAGFIQ